MPMVTIVVDASVDVCAEIAPLLGAAGLALERSLATDTLFVIKREANVPAHRRVKPTLPSLLRRQAD